MRVVICDDEQRYVNELVAQCTAFFEKKEMPAEIIGTTKPEDIFADVPDILVLDIEMPGMNGLEIRDRVSGGERPLIIFSTSYESYMPEAFGKNVIGFLKKPVSMMRLCGIMNNAIELLDIDTQVTFEDGATVKSRELLMITVDGIYSEVTMESGEKRSMIRKSLTDWQEDLEHYGFIRISKSCLLNSRYIMRFDGLKVILTNGQKLDVSRRRKEECVQKTRAYSKKRSTLF